jgi:hypothetical protein
MDNYQRQACNMNGKIQGAGSDKEVTYLRNSFH